MVRLRWPASGWFEGLEERRLLAADTLSIGVSNALAFRGSADANVVTVSYDPGSATYTIADSVDVINVTNLGTATVSGSGTNAVMVSGISAMSLDGGAGSDAIILRSTAVPTTITDKSDASGTNQTLTIGGGANGAQGITAPVTILGAVDSQAVTIDDTSGAAIVSSVLLDAESLTGLAPSTISLAGAGLSALTIDGSSGGSEIVVSGTPTSTALVTIRPGDGRNSVRVASASTGIVIDAVTGSTFVDVVTPATLGPGVTINGDSIAPNIDLEVDDSADSTAGRSFVVLPDVTADQNVVEYDYTPGSLTAFTLRTGGASDSVTMSQNPAPSNTIDTLGADSTVNIWALEAGSVLDMNESDPVVGQSTNIGHGGTLAAVQGLIVDMTEGVLNVPFAMNSSITLDDSSDQLPHTSTLDGELDFGSGIVQFGTQHVSLLDGAGVNQLLILDAYIPFGGFSYDGGAGATNPASSVELTGGPLPSDTFGSETYSATGPGSGTIAIEDPSTFSPLGAEDRLLTLSDAPAIDDLVQAGTFSVVAPSAAQFVDVVDGPKLSGIQTATIRSESGGFPSINFGNKAIVSLSTAASEADDVVHLDEPLPAEGLASLSIDGGDGDEVVYLDALPGPDVPISIAMGGGDDTLVATIAALASVPVVDGGTGSNTLRLTTDGTAIVLAPGSSSLPLGTPAGHGAVVQGSNAIDYAEFGEIDLANPAVSPVFESNGNPIEAVINRPLLSQDVAEFTSAVAGASASEFAAAIDWGDGSAPSAGVVVQDPTNTDLFHVSGSHSYSRIGTYQVRVTILDQGHILGTTVGDVPVTTSTPPSPPVTGTGSTISVADAPLTATGVAFSAIRGLANTGVVAVFDDPGGPNPSGYLINIDWGDGTSSAPARILALGSTPSGTAYGIVGRHAYSFVGTYAITVSIGASGQAVAIVGDAATVNPAPVVTVALGLMPVAGVPMMTVVGGFRDIGGAESTGAYQTEIDWGDGSPESTGTVLPFGPAGSFEVFGSHTYASSGVFLGSLTIAGAGISASTVPLVASVAAPSLTLLSTSPASTVPLSPVTSGVTPIPSPSSSTSQTTENHLRPLAGSSAHKPLHPKHPKITHPHSGRELIAAPTPRGPSAQKTRRSASKR